MSNLLSLQNYKNQVGVGTNIINVNSNNLTIKENTQNYIVCNSNDNSLEIYKTIELEDETTLSTVKTHSISSAKLLYIISNNEISSLALSSRHYLKVSNTGGVELIIDTTAPTITTLKIQSNNTIPYLAKHGEEITLEFHTNEAISTPSVTFTSGSMTIPSNRVSYSGSGTGPRYAKYLVNSSDTNGLVGFSLTVTDLSGNQTTSSTTTNSSTVTIDTVSPGPPSVTWPGGGNNGTVNVTLNDGGVSWYYSIDSGANFNLGSGNTFTLSHGTYNSNSIRVRQHDAVGNPSSVALNPSQIIYSGYGTNDIRHYNWIQNQQSSGVTRGDVGFIRIIAGPDSNPGSLQSDASVAGYVRALPGSFEDWNIAVYSQTYEYGYVVMPNPALPNTVTPNYTEAVAPFEGPDWPTSWGQDYNNYRYKITRQSNGNFTLENPWQGLPFETYDITGSSTQWEFIKHSSNATNGDPLWRIRVTSSTKNGKYLSIRTSAETTYWWVYGKHGYGYTDVLDQRTGWSKQLWRLEFL